MQFLAFTQIFLLFSCLGALVPGALCLPASHPSDIQLETAASPNAALEARSILEKRDSWDCKGSIRCSTMPQSACLVALNYFNNDDILWQEKRAWYTYDGFGYSCLARYSCGNVQDYVSAAQAGVSRGRNLVAKARTIYKQDGGRCTRCGQVYFWGTCKFSFDYCATNCAGN
ncbi:hypothetical protein EYR41_004180 [Orbilia oligospora]|uniref:Uncharacterized protein n=1 Tax=Orbilia oligospora TaxID=2813651 RepID=A0A7C8KJF5_ORBOL|nr:hypothetical protein TWF751_007531 [Orbilia oligospora]TGJ72273.1 hypothetical protein EYR41_004180 [Orbilia oligospora]